MPTFGAFFKALGLKTFAFYDHKVRPAAKNAEFATNFDIPRETRFDSIEKLLIAEIPADRHWDLLAAVRDAGTQGNLGIPAARPAPAQLEALVYNALRSNKGNGYAGQLIELCADAELPQTIVTFLREVHAHFPKPLKPPVLAPAAKVGQANAAQAQSATGASS